MNPQPLSAIARSWLRRALLLDLRRVENERLAVTRWNGQVPTPSVGGGALPWINLTAAR